MTTHSSATARGEAPHANRLSRTNTIMNALIRRAQAILNDRSIDPQSRAIIRYALETNDPWLARLVRRVDAGEPIGEDLSALESSEDDESIAEKIEALAQLICRDGDEAGTKAAAMLVLMSTLENASQPRTLANLAKHVAFVRCGELNLNGMIDVQIAELEKELLMSELVGQ